MPYRTLIAMVCGAGVLSVGLAMRTRTEVVSAANEPQ